MFALGLYLAVLLVFTFDVKKRVQGMLLVLGSAMTLSILAGMNVFLPNIEFTSSLNLAGAVVGVAVALFVESGQLLALDLSESSFERPTLSNGQVPEFRYAAGLLFVILSIAVVLTLVQAVAADVIRVFDVAASGIFLVTLYLFIQYESETRYLTLGPERSGKSMMTLGLCLELMRNAESHPRPNAYLQNAIERASNLSEGEERWPIPSTSLDEVHVGALEVISGYYFPRRLELRALDYAGQHLGRVAELIADEEVGADPTTVPEEVARGIVDADTLLFILDVERLVYPEQFQEAGVTDGQNISWTPVATGYSGRSGPPTHDVDADGTVRRRLPVGRGRPLRGVRGGASDAPRRGGVDDTPSRGSTVADGIRATGDPA